MSREFLMENGGLEEYRGQGGDITLPEDVRLVLEGAFSGCGGLTGVTVPHRVSDLRLGMPESKVFRCGVAES